MPAILDFVSYVPEFGFRWRYVSGEERAMGLPHIHSVLPWNPRGDDTPWAYLSISHPDINDNDLTTEASISQRLSVEWLPKKVVSNDGALFLRFAAIDTMQMDEVIQFANEWGALDENSWHFSTWEYEIRTMRFLVDLWEAVCSGRISGPIKEHFIPDQSGTIALPFFNSLLTRDLRRSDDERHHPGRFTTEPPIDAARGYLDAAINNRLRRSEQLVVGIDRSEKSPGLAFRPRSLRYALWLQFAIAVSEHKEYRRCETCGRAFELDPDINRKSRVYCNDACRVKAYRRRKAKVARLAAEGQPAPRYVIVDLDAEEARQKQLIDEVDASLERAWAALREERAQQQKEKE